MFLSPVVGADDETKVQPTFLGQLTVPVFPTPWGVGGGWLNTNQRLGKEGLGADEEHAPG